MGIVRRGRDEVGERRSGSTVVVWLLSPTPHAAGTRVVTQPLLDSDRADGESIIQQQRL